MCGHANAAFFSCRLLTSLLCCGLSLAITGPALGACKLLQVAAWHVDLDGLQPTVLGQIDGKPIRVLLDTGSYRTFVLGKDAAQLGLTALVHELKIGSLDLKDLTLYVLDTNAENRSFGMLLGADFFSAYDTELDLTHHVVRLFRNVDCQPQQLAYWSNGYFLAKLEMPSGYDQRFRMQIKLNGKRTTAVIDTGAALSFVSKFAAEDAGVIPGADGQPPQTASGLAGTERVWEGRFDSLAVGNETMQNAKLQIGELFENTTVMRTGSMLPQKIEGLDDRMLLGVDFLLAHHVMILPHEHQMLFTYNGGPVFRSPALDATRSEGPAIPGAPGAEPANLPR
jgi:predicted aspartyl protease